MTVRFEAVLAQVESMHLPFVQLILNYLQHWEIGPYSSFDFSVYFQVLCPVCFCLQGQNTLCCQTV